MIDIAINDDYAVLTTTNYGFYYGYEYDFEKDKYGDTHEIWGFEAVKEWERATGNKKLPKVAPKKKGK